MLICERLKALASHDRNRAITIGGSTVSQDTGCACNQAILAPRQDGLEAICGPSQKHQLSYRESELLPRFAAHYQQLKALRRRVRRSLQRQWKHSLAGLALLITLGQTPALAATINVGGTCTFVRAIVAANSNTTASGNCRKGSGADTIVLPRGSTQRLTSVNN